MTLFKTLESVAEQRPDAVALCSIGKPPLTYGGFLTQVRRAGEWLCEKGVTPKDRVAIVLPNGPEMAVAFLAVASVATSAPLNPAYRAEEFEFYLSDLEAKALIVQHGVPSPARSVAEKLGIPIYELHAATDGETGTFTLEGEPIGEGHALQLAEPEDVALVLHTSGTTSRPKQVPLTQANLCASAENIKTTLALDHNDRCLNIMPLFHIHGLVAVLLSSFRAGASVVCTPGFNAPRFFSWIEEFEPTWYSAVPTMHQGILARAGENAAIIAAHPMRFIRSSSASLPREVAQALERVFDTPVIEAYGMTEASHQIASNPLPPAVHKFGSVGKSAGPEVAIFHEEKHEVVSQGGTGEIVLKGPTITGGYVNNPTANASSFTDGWFRTGDQGYLDEDGYLFITGRLKEIINRGAEKISPAEVDVILMEYPAVAQAVTFSVPHPQLGEEVAAAVVLHENASADEAQILEHVVKRLADFKVPRRILILDELPKGATGKVQRIGMAEKLGVISVGGRLIDTARIETCLKALPGVEKALVAAKEDAEGVSRLVAYLVHSGSAEPTLADMRSVLSRDLPDFMVPADLFVLDDIPCLADGKPDLEALPSPRASAAVSRDERREPKDEIESTLVRLWQEVLEKDDIGVNDDFFELGGDSLLAEQLLLRIDEEFGKLFFVSVLFEAVTIAEMAEILRQEDWKPDQTCLVKIQPNGSKPPCFCIHARLGEVLFYRDFAMQLGPDQPSYGLRARGLDGSAPPHSSIEEMASDYIKEIQTVQPEGPYHIVGHCYGGVIAFEMAKQLLTQGEKVAFLGLIDVSAARLENTVGERLRYVFRELLENPMGFLHYLFTTEIPYWLSELKSSLADLFPAGAGAARDTSHSGIQDNFEKVRKALETAYDAYQPTPYAGRISYFINSQRAHILHNKWFDLAEAGVDLHVFPGKPDTTFNEPSLSVLCAQVRESLSAAQEKIKNW